ncbi:protein kinase [Streptomyces incarnatus]
MDDYAGRVLADRYRLPLPPSDAYEPAVTRAFDTYSGQEVLVRQVPLPEVVEAEVLDADGLPEGFTARGRAARAVPAAPAATRRPAEPAVRRAVEAAQAAARIPDHPRLDQVFDVFAEGGSLWIVSEWVAARPLSALLAERPLTPYRAAEVASDVLMALRVLHAHGWVHRNVTARTVLVCDDGRVLLTGLAAGAAEEALCGYDPVPGAEDEGEVLPGAARPDDIVVPDAVDPEAARRAAIQARAAGAPGVPGVPGANGVSGRPEVPAGSQASGTAGQRAPESGADIRAARAGAIAAYRAGARAAARVQEAQQGERAALPGARRPTEGDTDADRAAGGGGPGEGGNEGTARSASYPQGSPYPQGPPYPPGPAYVQGAPRPQQPYPRQPYPQGTPYPRDPASHRADPASADPSAEGTGAARPSYPPGQAPYPLAPAPHRPPSDAPYPAVPAPRPDVPPLPPGYGTHDAPGSGPRGLEPARHDAPAAAVPPQGQARWDEPASATGARRPAGALAAERARQARMAVVGPVTERWAPEQAGPVHANWQLAAPVGPATDLWALGALLFRAVQGHAPYPEESTAELVQLVCAEPPAYAEECGPLRPVVESLLRQDPTERPDFEELGGWLRSLVRSAPEPEAGTRVVPVPPDPRRLPIVRRRGELVRRRRAGLPDAHARHKRDREEGSSPSRLGRTLLVLILLLLAGAVAYAMLFMPKQHATHGRSGTGATPSAGPASPGPSRSQHSPSASDTQAGGTSSVPAGFTLRKDPEGFDIAVAKGWTRTPKNGSGEVVYAHGDFELMVVPGRDAASAYGSDPMAYQRDKERELQPYRDSSWATATGLRTIEVGGRTMAEGQFTWTDGQGRDLYVRNMAILLNGRYHILQVRGPDADRDEVSRLYEEATATYRYTG